MSISYSGLTNYGKATNPSVEMGLGSMNILRDPPRSITTRRVDKVGQTSSITEMIDDSGNRACEAINLYARGVNLLVFRMVMQVITEDNAVVVYLEVVLQVDYKLNYRMQL